MAGNSGRALVAAPLKYNGSFEEGKFDNAPYDSKAVVLKLDRSVVSFNINADNEAVSGGKRLLQTGPETVWGEGISPVMKKPLPK